MIIFGTTSLTLTKDRGTFFCPRCFEEGQYHHKRVRRFFTLYFIPLIPLDLLGEYVQCRTCRQSFDPVVLQMSAGDYQQVGETEFHEELHRAMALMMVAGDSASDEAMTTAAELYAEVSGQSIGHDQVLEEIAAARESGDTVQSYLELHRDEWSDDGKDFMARALFLVASASGNLNPAQQVQLETIPSALQISEERFRRIVEQAVSD